MIQKLLNQDWLRGVMFTLILAGIVATAIGVWQYFDAAQELRDNRAQQLRDAGEEVPVESQAEVSSLFASEMRRNELIEQQNNAMILGGGGLVVLAFGWIGLDLIRSYHRRKNDIETVEPTEPDTVTS